MDSLNHLDVALYRAVNQGLASPLLDGTMLFISHRYTWVAVGAIAIAFGLWKMNRRFLVFCVTLGLTIGLSDFFTYQALKPTFARSRPCHQLEDVRLVQDRCGGDYGFPSNHAANSMATATLVALVVRRRWAWWVFAAALLVGFTRIYLGVHFPGDVLAGFCVGGVIGWLCYRVALLAKVPLKAKA